MSLFYTFRSCGYLASAPIGLLLNRFLDRKVILCANLASLSVTIFLVPLCKVILGDATVAMSLVYIVSSINGISSGIIEAIGNVWLLEIWPMSRTTAFMQGLHFSFALGCAFAPTVVAANFLINKFISLSYGVCSLFICVPIIMSILLLMRKTSSRQEDKSEKVEARKRKRDEKEKGATFASLLQYFMNTRRKVILLCCICMLFYSGSSILYNQFLPAFLVSEPINMGKTDASLLHSLLNYAVSLGRVLSIFIAMKVPPQAVIISNLSLFFLGSMVIYLFPSTHILWLGNMIIGLSWSSVSAPLYSFLKRHMKVTSVTGSVFVFCNGFTSAIMPYSMAKLMAHDSSYLMIITMTTVSLSLSAFLAVYMIVSSLKVPDSALEASSLPQVAPTESCELKPLNNAIDTSQSKPDQETA